MSRAEHPDNDALVAFHLRNIRAGCVISLTFCALYIWYLAVTPEDPNRLIIFGLVIVAIVATVIMLLLPLERLLHGRFELFFTCWTIGLVTLISLSVALDGGADSPFMIVVFVPVGFSALSYPMRPALTSGAIAVGAYLAIVAIDGGVPYPTAVFTAATLAGFTLLGAWQASNSDRHRGAMAQASRTDVLTGCLNRRGFEHRMTDALDTAKRDNAPVSLILFDLDDFKEVNDVHGHAAGDDLLCWVVRRVEASLRDGEILGRLGGDEFAVVIAGARHARAARRAEELEAALAERVHASFGVAAYPDDGETDDALHHVADAELYRVKRAREARPRELGWAAALAQAVDLRMAGGHDHSAAVGDLAARIATQLGWGADDVAAVRLAATLHDVGKAAVPDAILRKPGRLDPEEVRIVRAHPPIGADMVGRIPGMERIAQWIRCSHERPDGHGYPLGLHGPEIPEASRIIHVADAFDAMTSDLPYREALSTERALEELQRCAGTQFDPDCVHALAEVVGVDPATLAAPAA